MGHVRAAAAAPAFKAANYHVVLAHFTHTKNNKSYNQANNCFYEFIAYLNFCIHKKAIN